MDSLSNHEDDGFVDVTHTVKTRSFKLNRDSPFLMTSVPIDTLQGTTLKLYGEENVSLYVHVTQLSSREISR